LLITRLIKERDIMSRLMSYTEATQSSGSLVKVNTVTKGSYIGELMNVLPYKMWKGKVKILSIVQFPDQLAFAKAAQYRTPLEYEAVEEFNSNSIEKYYGEIAPYDHSLLTSLDLEIYNYSSLIQNTSSHFHSENKAILNFLIQYRENIYTSYPVPLYKNA
jgi:hypothetical protein